MIRPHKRFVHLFDQEGVNIFQSLNSKLIHGLMKLILCEKEILLIILQNYL